MITRTEENRAEFTEASRVATLIRYAANKYFGRHTNVHANLLARCLLVVQADTESARGERKFKNANATILKQFNVAKTSVQSLLPVTFSNRIESAPEGKKAKLAFNIPFVPVTDCKKPAGATHLLLTTALVALNPDVADELPILTEKKEVIPINSITAIASIETENTSIPANYITFAIVDVSFAQEVNAVLYPLQSKNLNASFISDTILA